MQRAKRKSPSLSIDPLNGLYFSNKSIFTYLLSFAYVSTHSMALVSKNFYTTIRSRDYWAHAARFYFRNSIPRIILNEVDFFHGLSKEDPPYLFLGRILDIDYPPQRIGDFGMAIESVTMGKSWAVSWASSLDPNRRKSFAITLSEMDYEKRVLFVTYFNRDPYRKAAYVREGPNLRCVYSEFWDPEHKRVWCGVAKQTIFEPGKDLPENPEPVEPFGTWITF